MKEFFASWGLVIVSAICDSYAAYIVKYKFNEQGRIDFSSLGGFLSYVVEFVQSPLLLSAVITFVAAPALWFFALNRLELSVAYPVLVSLHLLLVMFVGVSWLNETFTLNKAIGTALILLSLFFFYSTSETDSSDTDYYEDHSRTVAD